MFIFLFVVSMMIHLVTNDTTQRWDAYYYWELGKSCCWDVRNIESGFRGWVLPYIFWLCFRFGVLLGYEHEFLGYQIFSSVAFAFTFTFTFAYIAGILKFEVSDKRMAVSGGICGILIFIFYKGLFIYTLSDFYAFALSLIAVILTHEIVKCQRKLYVKVLEAFLLGICLYGTYNIRTIYLFSIFACWGVLIIWQLCHRDWKQILVTVPVCFMGMLVCSIPQYIMNYNLLRIYSWRVPTQGLMLNQLQWGIVMERYATFVGDSSQYGDPGMIFRNNIGETILNRFQLTEITSYTQIVKLILRYPLDFIGIYVRHFLNILYPIYPNQYIYDIDKDKTLILILFYTILFVGITTFLSSFKLRNSKWVWFILLLVPCICILPGAVEDRFFIAFYFLVCMYAVLGIKEFVVQFKKNKVKYIMVYFVGFLLYISYLGMLLSTTIKGIATIN